MTVYTRMTWGLSLLTLVTLGAAFIVFSIVLDRYQEKQMDDSLIDIAHGEAIEATQNDFAFTTRPGPAANDIGPLDKFGVIYDEEGFVLSATRPFDVSPPGLHNFPQSVDQPFDFSFNGHTYRGVLVPIPKFPNRRMLLAASREDLDGDSRFVRNAMGIALCVSMAWLIGAIRWLVQRNMREHKRMAEILHRVASGDTGVRADQVYDEELKLMASDVDEIAQKLAALIGYQRRFIANAAHELRSPLAALHGEIQMAQRKQRTVEEYVKSLAFMGKASTRLTVLANELLELARAEHAAAPATAVSVRAAVDDVVESLEPLAKAKEIKIQKPDTECSVMSVKADVERVLRNLLDNAIRHAPSGSTAHLEVDVDQGTKVVIRVRDEGSGVPEEERERIFEPFHRSPKNRAEGRGTGLGLAIARELARKHGGDLRVGRELNCFELELPRAA